MHAKTGKRFICGNAGVNEYGTDNMAEQIRYRDIRDESVLVVTLIAADTLRGLADANGRFFFTEQPPGPFRALWEATTFVVWRLYKFLRPITVYREGDEPAVSERSLQNLFSAIRETQRAGRKVLIVLSPLKAELNGHESALTRHVRSVLAGSGFDVLDLHAAVSGAVSNDFYYDQIHLDVVGHRFYAEAIADRLEPTLSDGPGSGGSGSSQKP